MSRKLTPEQKEESLKKQKARHRSYYLKNREQMLAFGASPAGKSRKRELRLAKPWLQKLRNSRSAANKLGYLPILTPKEEVEAFWKETDRVCQNSRCGAQLDSDAVCYMDHCHNTGDLRGKTCVTCNAALGSAKDSIEVLKGLIEYLEETPFQRWKRCR